jgi:hypothetical protein
LLVSAFSHPLRIRIAQMPSVTRLDAHWLPSIDNGDGKRALWYICRFRGGSGVEFAGSSFEIDALDPVRDAGGDDIDDLRW